MKHLSPITIGVIVVSAVIIGGIILAAILSGGSSVAQYKTSDPDKPQLAIGETNFDFGRIKLSDIKIQEIEIKNTGNRPLIIYDAITSCDCTFVQFIIGGIESRKFSMRRDLSWRGEIVPQEEATIRLIYQPSLMPVKGAVKREVVFKTNDPSYPLVNLRFNAIIE
ncbi:MAG: DUF1573 domain-containing protein [bacterium]|nr:DUF1573 domain-containing protein [bacterium]